MDQPAPPLAASRGLFGRLAGLNSFSGNVAANYLGRGWEALMGVAFVPLYIRFLGPEAYGVIGVVAVIQSFMLILDFGMTPALTREAARFGAGVTTAQFLKDLVRSVELVVAGLALVIVGVLAAIAPFVAGSWVKAGALDPQTIALSLTIGGALIAMRFFESVFRGALFGLQRQVLCNAIGAVAATVRGGGAVAVVALSDAGLPGFFLWQIAASAMAVLAMRAGVAMALPPTDRGGRFSRPALSAIGRFALGMLAVSVLSLAATQADKLVLSRLLPLADFGYYMFAANVALVLELLAAPVMTALYPRVVALFEAGDEAVLAAFFHRWARIVTVLTAPAAAWLVFLAPELLLAWSGDAVLAERSGALLSVLAIGTFLHAQCVLPYYLQLARGWTSLAAGINALALVATVPVLLLLVPRHGAEAGAWTWVGVASLYVVVGLNVMFGHVLRRERWRFFLLDTGLPALAAFATMAAASQVALAILPQLWIGRVVVLGLALLAALAAAAAVAWALDRRAGFSPAR